MWREGKKLTTVARLWALGQLHTPDQDESDATSTASTTTDALAHFGLVASEPIAAPDAVNYPKVYLWPEHAPVYQLWLACQTQWLGDMGGRSGLNYPGVEIVMRRRFGLRGKKSDDYFALLQAMEIAALNAWAKQKDK